MSGPITDATIDVDRLDLNNATVRVAKVPNCPPAVRIYCGNDVTFRIGNVDKLSALIDALMAADRDLRIAIVDDLADRSLSSVFDEQAYLRDQDAQREQEFREEEDRAKGSIDPEEDAA